MKASSLAYHGKSTCDMAASADPGIMSCEATSESVLVTCKFTIVSGNQCTARLNRQCSEVGN